MPDNSTVLSPNNKEDAVIYFAANGLKPQEIAERVGCTPHYVNSLFKEEKFQFQVKQLRYKLFGKDAQKKFKDLIPYAIDALEEVISNPNHKAQLRFTAAQEIFDRVLGKPKQTVQHEGNLLQEVYERLEGNGKKTIIDVSPDDDGLPKIEEPDAASTLEEKPNIRDSIDSWIKENL